MCVSDENMISCEAHQIVCQSQKPSSQQRGRFVVPSSNVSVETEDVCPPSQEIKTAVGFFHPDAPWFAVSEPAFVRTALLCQAEWSHEWPDRAVFRALAKFYFSSLYLDDISLDPLPCSNNFHLLSQLSPLPAKSFRNQCHSWQNLWNLCWILLESCFVFEHTCPPF